MAELRPTVVDPLGPLQRDGEYWRSRDGRWSFGHMPHSRRWQVWEDGRDRPWLGEVFVTLSDAKARIRQRLRHEAIHGRSHA